MKRKTVLNAMLLELNENIKARTFYTVTGEYEEAKACDNAAHSILSIISSLGFKENVDYITNRNKAVADGKEFSWYSKESIIA